MSLKLAAALGSAALAFALASAVSAAPDPFVGAWKSIDIDGSSQTLGVGGGPGSSHHMQLFDDLATSCGTPFSSATVQGTGTEAGNTLTVTYSVNCHNGNTIGDKTITYTFDPGTTTLTDSVGVVWSRP